MTHAQWFALDVQPHHENVIRTILENKGYEVLLPLYASRRVWSDRIKILQLPLFPGYLFCRFDPSQTTAPVVTTPGVKRIVSFGGRPAPVDEAEIDSVRAIVHSTLATQPWPYLREGALVRITSGALKDLEGILVKTKGQDQLVVSISLLQRSIAVAIDRAQVCPA